jgi:hypothetical protein
MDVKSGKLKNQKWSIWAKILFTAVLGIFITLLPMMITNINIYGPAIVWIIALYIFWLILNSKVKLSTDYSL